MPPLRAIGRYVVRSLTVRGVTRASGSGRAGGCGPAKHGADYSLLTGFSAFCGHGGPTTIPGDRLMFASMPIGKKIAAAFCAVILAVLVMMTVLWTILARIEATSAVSGRGQEVLAQTMQIEIGILRQNSQMRGFLVTGDESYLKQYREGQEQG
ncbi:MAG: hypothetical protein EOP68_25535 [Sphingomonas sp.]|nr:MAG: hypothetical protein EOP68_25535 [Sphingomonas sp.]